MPGADVAVERRPDADADYLCVRVVDTLLREDVRECLSRGRIVGHDAVPAGAAACFGRDQRWLEIGHFGSGRLWIPVVRSEFMQAWRLARLPLVWLSADDYRLLDDVAAILACFHRGLTEAEARGFVEFETECRAALEHRRICEAERERWFREWRLERRGADGAELPEWHDRLLHYDRVAAFRDHPFYPSARAKLGFSGSDLPRYAPEFAPAFELNWLAVPHALYHAEDGALPPGWPSFSEVGLDAGLVATHRLVPVHPFVWQRELDDFLDACGLAAEVVRAPHRALAVTPTLSVRTLALCEAPAWHVKLPLTIRTLGGRNIRTIKPSTIGDGHRIQSLLGAIVEREPELRGRVLLTAEDTGAHVAGQPFLGFIVRRYPQAQLREATPVPVAALSAHAPAGPLVVEELIGRFFDGDRAAFLDEYLSLTLRLHLTLWLRYGVALESNQQNSVLVLRDGAPRLQLLLKDNDAARIHRARLSQRWPALAEHVADLQDARIGVDTELPLAQMFATITLQLNVAVLVETVARLSRQDPRVLYRHVRRHIEDVLRQLAAEGEDVALARRVLLEAEGLPIKYLLVAATLLDKQTTGAADVNKYYGCSAPNFLREPR